MSKGLIDALASRPLVLDAAIGTRLIAGGLDLRDDDPALWNLTHPETVAELHALDIAAGSDALLTNTFGADPTWLSRFDRAVDATAINRRAVALARDAAGPERFVVGSIGPRRVAGAVRDQAMILVEAGVDAILFETHTPSEALAALDASRSVLTIPLWVSLHVAATPDDIRRLADSGADAIGSNCDSLCAARRLAGLVRETVGLPGLAQPSGGLPGKRAIEPRSFAAAVPGLLKRGVRLFGGCCGTTEHHVAALRKALDLARHDGL